ncbi:MAG TPA: hemerythrin domain-containing protein [Burkholderiaceae bacterium]|nr:hemerythrin domain-containing protein [Burkholderiaceae bacterium]
MPHKTAGHSSSLDAIELLTADHRKVMQMFDDFSEMEDNGKAGDDKKQILVERICTELTMHSQVEEELFYPALRDALEDHAQLDEAEVEHAMANELVSELESMQPGDDLYDAKVTVLGEYTRHHIEEEQKELFPKAKKAKVDMAALGEEIQKRKEELRSEFGMPEEEETLHMNSKSKTRKPSHHTRT